MHNISLIVCLIKGKGNVVVFLCLLIMYIPLLFVYPYKISNVGKKIWSHVKKTKTLYFVRLLIVFEEMLLLQNVHEFFYEKRKEWKKKENFLVLISFDLICFRYQGQKDLWSQRFTFLQHNTKLKFLTSHEELNSEMKFGKTLEMSFFEYQRENIGKVVAKFKHIKQTDRNFQISFLILLHVSVILPMIWIN